jgi:hypothetical protein
MIFNDYSMDVMVNSMVFIQLKLQFIINSGNDCPYKGKCFSFR